MSQQLNEKKQAAVIAVHQGRVCLITSRRCGRWIIPKGHLEVGKTAGEIALQEAWEEAGITGAIQRQPVGTYLYEKSGGRYRVTVFLMTVTEVSTDWPERDERTRRWVRPDRALMQIQEPGLRKLLTKVLGIEVLAAMPA
jgi:8-oxo-dGTP pyrophosphatase MutT (NUDIX family)